MEMRGHDFVRKIEQMWNESRPEMMDELFDRSFQMHTGLPGLQDFEGQKRLVQMFMGAFSDMHWETPTVMSEGDTFVFRYQGDGRHTGDFMGVPATNKHVCMGGVTVARMRDGKVYEAWDYFDAMGLMMQLRPEMASQFMGGMGQAGMGEGAMGGREAA